MAGSIEIKGLHRSRPPLKNLIEGSTGRVNFNKMGQIEEDVKREGWGERKC